MFKNMTIWGHNFAIKYNESNNREVIKFMKLFWAQNKSIIGKCIMYQFGAAFLGIMLAMTAASAKNDTLFLITSVFSVLFYLCLIYTLLWDCGARERIRVDSGRAKKSLFNGLKISFFANVPNIVLSLFVYIGTIFGSTSLPFKWEWAGNLAGISKTLILLWESMYLGLVQLYMPNNIFAYSLIILPALLVSCIAYILGFNNFRLLSVFGVKPKENKK